MSTAHFTLVPLFNLKFQDYPANITCQHCKQQITTTIFKESGTLTFLAVDFFSYFIKL